MSEPPVSVEKVVDRLLEHVEGDELGEHSLELEPSAGGYSNETWFLEHDGEEFVLRCPPHQPPPKHAKMHDVEGEHRVLSALQDTDVPVPETLFYMETADGEGYVMRRVAGDVIRGLPGDEPEDVTDESHRRRLAHEMTDVLASLHTVDVEAVGLQDWVDEPLTPEGEVESWSEQLEVVLERADRENPELREAGEWLQGNVPEPKAVDCVVHGDFKLDNVVWSEDTPPELNAVLDRGMASVGDPFLDLGWFLCFWWGGGEDDPALPELNPTFMTHDDYPTRQELKRRYEEEVGFGFDEPRFYRALAAFKLAVIAEDFHLRFHLESDDGDWLGQALGAKTMDLSERALRLTKGEEPM